METYTVGQAIDKLEFGEVAIIVAGISSGICPLEDHDYLQTGFYFDEHDSGVLKSLGGNSMSIAKTNDIEKCSAFVIMPRDAYERIKYRTN